MPVSDPKHVAAMLVGEMHPKDAPGGEDMGAASDEADPGEEAAAEEMLSAFQSNDPKALASAMKSFVEICMGKY